MQRCLDSRFDANLHIHMRGLFIRFLTISFLGLCLRTRAQVARQLDVLKLLVAGDTYTEIADSLVISPLTVRSHMENIYRKLQVQNKANVINIALKNRWF